MTERRMMCAYGNCNETMQAGDYRMTTTESHKGRGVNRYVFCCIEHAWRQLKCDDERMNGKRPEIEMSP